VKRFALALTTVALLSSSACSDNSGADGAKAGSTVDAGTSPQRFQALWTEYLALADTLDSEALLTSAAEANQSAGLSQDTNLHYADLSGTARGGKWCIESDDNTYLAMIYGAGESVILMGDDECTYDDGRAIVVGDFMAAEWTRGAELMGDVPASP
jgi:hypothetical protein